MVEIDGGGEVVIVIAEGVLGVGVRTNESEITNTGTMSTDGDCICGTSNGILTSISELI
ncbi:hypothetical protein Tco_0634165, partial [Tanacetum coccineum]